MNIHDNKQQMQQVLTALASGDFAPFRACMADDLVWTVTGTTPLSRTYVGKADVLDHLLKPLAALLDGPFRMVTDRVTAEGDVVVVEGRGQNRLRDGRPYENTYCWVCRFEGGRLRELTEYMDTDLVARIFAATG
ncbi:nuclear transport factor 2 family protein [Sorangium sp. So ce1389]|uniref:nuclear transport factor 2 family protein n=1 Tax=Sorangium sp. So ce1389 TaxID=3133336 RepID=UPI003F5F52BB